MKSITENRRPVSLKLPTIFLGLIAMWNYKKYGYPINAIVKSTFYGYSRMIKGYKRKIKEKRVNQMMFFAKHHLFQNNKSITN